MTVVMHQIMETDPHHLGDVWHLSLSQEGRGSPSEEQYEGGHYRMSGMARERTVHLLRRLADLVEQGKSIKEISTP